MVVLKRILIVDDDEDVLTVAKYSLCDLEKVEITTATSGALAIKEALLNPPSLILLDLMMPEMDGQSTLKALRLIPTLSQIPVIFFTARVQPEQFESYKKQGAVDVIIKPFDPLTLPKVVKEIWDRITT